VSDALSETAIRQANVFDPAAVSRLRDKCRTQAEASGDLSNSDNMALVGVLSTQLLHQQFISRRPDGESRARLCVDVDIQHSAEVLG
jgi:asparagine synthase (glutamine-hydrolysing)